MQRRVPPAEVSVGVHSKEQLLRFNLLDKGTCFVILVSVIVRGGSPFIVHHRLIATFEILNITGKK